MKSLINTIDSLPLPLKLILALPGIDIVWVIYRLAKSIIKNNTAGIVIALAVIIIGLPWLWLIDLLCLLILGNVWWLD